MFKASVLALDKIKNTCNTCQLDLRCNMTQAEEVQLFLFHRSLNWKFLLLPVVCLQKSEFHTLFQVDGPFLHHRSYPAVSSISNSMLQSTSHPWGLPPIYHKMREGSSGTYSHLKPILALCSPAPPRRWQGTVSHLTKSPHHQSWNLYV